MTLRTRDRERIIQEQQARQEGWFRWSKPSRYIVFLILIVAIISGLWLLIAEVSDPTPTSTLHTVQSDEEPYKVKVDEQEILSVRHQDKLVYSRIHKGGDVPRVEHLLPEPEEPIALAEANKDVEIVIEETQPETTVAKQVEPAIVEAVEVEEGIDSIASLIDKEGLAKKAGPYVQLGTLDSQEQAQQEWNRLKKKHKDMLGQLNPLIEKVDLGERGTRYRLRVGPYDKLADAQSAAKELEVRKVGCIVIP